MSRVCRYAVDMGWNLMLHHLGIVPQDVLRTAGLALDLFQRESASISSPEYWRLWDALGQVSNDPTLPLSMVDAMQPEAFSPALFACLCSENLDAALRRLSQYKPLVGPMTLALDKTSTETIVEIGALAGDLAGDMPPPVALLAAELVFFVHLARLGTRDRVEPIWVETPVRLPEPRAYADWFGCVPRLGDKARVAFRRLDCERPFLTANHAMWSAFEPGLQRRLSDTIEFATMAGRLRAWFNQTIASSRTGIDDAARDLGISTRSLQRKLADEDTSFQQVLSSVREDLARHYLTRTRLSTSEIAFLLGYSEQNSFYRAFHHWTGETPDKVRSTAN